MNMEKTLLASAIGLALLNPMPVYARGTRGSEVSDAQDDATD